MSNTYNKVLYAKSQSMDDDSESSEEEMCIGADVHLRNEFLDGVISSSARSDHSRSSSKSETKGTPTKQKIVMVPANGMNSSSHSRSSRSLSSSSHSKSSKCTKGLGESLISRSMHSKPLGRGYCLDSKKRDLLNKWKTDDSRSEPNHQEEDGDGGSPDSSSIDSGVGADDDAWWQSSDEERDSTERTHTSRRQPQTDGDDRQIRQEDTMVQKSTKGKKKHKTLIRIRASRSASVSNRSRSLQGHPFEGLQDPQKLHDMLSNWASERSLGKDDCSTAATSVSTGTGVSVATDHRDNTSSDRDGSSRHRKRRSTSRVSSRSSSPATVEEFAKQGVSCEQLLNEDDQDSLTRNPHLRRSKSLDSRHPKGLERGESTQEASCHKNGATKVDSECPRESTGKGISGKTHVERSKRSERRGRSADTERSADGLGHSSRSKHKTLSISKHERDEQKDNRSKRSERRSRSAARERSRHDKDRSHRSESRSRHRSRSQSSRSRRSSCMRKDCLLGDDNAEQVSLKVLDTGIITEEQIYLLRAAGFGLHELTTSS